MNARHNSLTSLLAFLMIATAGSVSRATEATIENYGNTPIYVAIAYRHSYENHVAKGWFKIEPTQSRTFSAPDDREMAMLVHRDGKPVTFVKHQEFLRWPTAVGQRFVVDRPGDDGQVRFLRWGENLEHTASVQKGHYPNGWALADFFILGAGKQRLEVKPQATASLVAGPQRLDVKPKVVSLASVKPQRLEAKSKLASVAAAKPQQEEPKLQSEGGIAIIPLPE